MAALNSREHALELDRQDELGQFRSAFWPAAPGVIYLDGNSLGRLPTRTMEHIGHVVQDQWGAQMINGWRQAGWMEMPSRVGDKIGRLIGAAQGQVVCTDSTSVNLFKLVMAALQHQAGRSKLVSDKFNFPTDLYVMQGGIKLLDRGHRLHLVESPDGVEADETALLEAIDEDTALVSLSHPAFRSCYAYDLKRLTQHAHSVGALVLWDFSHGLGAVPLAVDDWDVDLAVGCTYKYGNGGPGSPAWLYVKRDLQQRLVSPIWGWWSHAEPFDFVLDYRPESGIERFLCGSPPVLSMSAVESAMDLLLEAGIERVRAKSVRLTSYLCELARSELTPLGFRIGSPLEASRRGGHVLLCHDQGLAVNTALVEEMGVITDFRPPDGIRVAPIALYSTFEEVWQAVCRLGQVVREGRQLKYASRTSVTN